MWIFQRAGTGDHQSTWNPVCDRKIICKNLFPQFNQQCLLLIEQPDLYDDMKEGDTIDVVMNQHVDYNGKEYPIASLPENLMSIIQAGGLVKAMRKLNGLED